MNVNKQFLRIILGFMLLLFMPIAFASQHTCTTTSRMITTGMTMDQVIRHCGRPTLIQAIVRHHPAFVNAYQWIYSLPLLPHQKLEHVPHIVVTFQNDKVRHIETFNMVGYDLGSAAVFQCYQLKKLQVGDDTTIVEQMCGSPLFVNAVINNVTVRQYHHLERWTYDFGDVHPALHIIFKDGVVEDVFKE